MTLKRDITQQFLRRYLRIPRGAMQSETQSPIPSQDQPIAPPFNPGLQPDMKQPVRTTRRPFMNQGDDPIARTPMTPDNTGDVRHVWDSRPINGYDVYFTDAFIPNPTFAAQLGGYNVPVGYNFFLRHITVSIWPNSGGADNEVLNILGPTTQTFLLAPFTNSDVQMSLLVDGSPTPYWTAPNNMANGSDPVNNAGLSGISMVPLGCDDIEIPCFIPVPSGSNVTAAFFAASLPLGIDAWRIFVHYYGNLISDTGRAITNEAGNADPLPVIVTQGE
jgi:hypothetical protein